MKPLSLNLSQMKKVGGDKNSSTFLHPSGHKMVIAHQGVSALQRKQLESLPIQKMAEGGDTDRSVSLDLNATPPDQIKDASPDDTSSAPFTSVAAAIPGLGGLPQDKITPDDNTISDNTAPAASPPLNGVALASNGPVTADQVAAMGGSSQPADNSPQPGPEAGAPANVQPTSGAGGVLEGGYQQGQNAISEQQSVDAKLAKAKEQELTTDIASRQALDQGVQDNLKNFTEQQSHFIQDYANNHVNPSSYIQNMGTAEKVSTGIGLLLGGFSSAFTGGGNPAMEFLNKQIDRDIQAQESRLGQQKTLLGANQEMFHDQTVAANMTRVNMNDIYDHKIQLAAAKLGTPQAKAAADMAHAKFAMENAGLLQQSALRGAALNGAMTGTVDPAKLVAILVPKEHQAKAFGEIEAAENTRKMGGSILKAFDDAATQNTAIRRAGGLRGDPASVGALHQAMQPTFKDLEGTVRQAAMDNTFQNITPARGDLDSTIKTKRRALEEYLQSKMSAPTARGYGIDLQRFPSTAPMQQTHPQEGKTGTLPNGQRVIMRGGKLVPFNG